MQKVSQPSKKMGKQHEQAVYKNTTCSKYPNMNSFY